MAYYLKGIGDRLSGTNEILPQLDARMICFLVGQQHGIITGELNTFGYTTIDRGIRIRSGLIQAWGYFAMSDSDVQFNFVMPSALTQYVQIYAEIDLAKSPQLFEIKVTAQSSSNSFSPQQDNLRTNPSGKYQFWLHTAILYTNNTIGVTDRRTYITKPLNAVNADDYTSSGGIATKFNSLDTLKAPLASPALTGTPTAPTAAQTVNNTQLATTGYVRQAISDAKNITYGTLTYSRSVSSLISNSIKRQVNFVIGVFDCNFSSSTGPAVIANIPANFRPKSDMQFEGYYKYIVSSTNQSWGGARFTIRTNGDLEYSGQVSGNENIGTAQNHGFRVKFGYEIT